MPLDQTRTATLYRMQTDAHICPFGLKSRHLLETEGFDVDDHVLETRDEADAFMEKHGVKTTPQTFIGGERVGGYEDLRRHFDKPVADDDETVYQPVLVVFTIAALIALAAAWRTEAGLFDIRTIEWFVATSMTLLAMLKLRDLTAFSNQFLGYDLLAQRWVPYAYLYPFGEALAGVLMIAGLVPWLSGPVALFIGTVGAVSVIKAVYVDGRELKCACVGGGSNVPLGFLSLTENLAMVGMGTWALVRAFGL